VKSTPISLVAMSILMLGLAGCEHLPGFLAWMKPQSHMVKVTPLPANFPPVDPNAAEDRLYAGAVKAIEDRDYAMALDALQMAQAARPKDPRVLSAMGVVYDKLGRFDLSARYYDLAEAADPGSKIVAINRRYSLLLQQSELGNNSGGGIMLAEAGGSPGPAAAVSAMRPSAPEPQSVSTDVAYAQAVQQIRRGDYTRALALLQWAKSTNADDPRVLSAMGVIYDKLGRFDLSGRYYDLAERADPGSKVVAMDRRYSRLLQQHGGAVGDTGVSVLGDKSSLDLRT
jgi:Flp pilus assembly protein TadD